jgi:hypothetical protein
MSYFLLSRELNINDAVKCLGALVCDINRPTDSFFPGPAFTVVGDEDLLRPIKHSVSKLQFTGRDQLTLRAEVHKFLGIGGKGERGRNLDLESREITIYSTQNHDSVLKKVIEQHRAETWIQNAPGDVYMLVGFISAVDAVVTAGTGTLSSVNANFRVPVSAMAGVPGNVSIGAEAQHETQYRTNRHGRLQDEVVFAAEYRRVMKKKVFYRRTFKVGPYSRGFMRFGAGESGLNVQEEGVEVEAYEYELEDMPGTLFVEAGDGEDGARP